MIITLFVFLLVLSILVLIHEAGHFFVAKKFGIKVEEFGFGIPPRAFGIKKGETIYSINWLPIGGFVKLYGEDEAGSGRIAVGKTEEKIKDEKRAFYSRSIGQRAAIVIAGVVMNAILAIIIFYAYFFLTNFKAILPLLGDHKFFLTHQQNVNITDTDSFVSYVSPNSPAEKAGILPHAKIVAVNGQQVYDRSSFIKTINKNRGKEVTLLWQDIYTNSIHTTRVIPRISPPKDQGALGIAFPPTAILSYDTSVERILSGVSYPVNMLSYSLDVMGKLVSISFEKKTIAPVSQGVSGPVGIFSLVGTIVRIPAIKELTLQLLSLAGLLSISLAFFNVLPIPALDGGRLFFILTEVVVGHKLNPKFEGYANAVGMAALLTLIVLVTFKDLIQFGVLHLFGQ